MLSAELLARFEVKKPATPVAFLVPRPGGRNTLDRATSSLPRLLHRRLDDFGLDVAIIYPSMGLFPIHFDDPEVRLSIAITNFSRLH